MLTQNICNDLQSVFGPSKNHQMPCLSTARDVTAGSDRGNHKGDPKEIYPENWPCCEIFVNSSV